jgi:polyphosphate kinase
MASADWMPRNLHKRIEVAFPVEDGRLRERVEEEILGRQLLDTAKARLLQPDGRYLPAARRPGTPARRSQLEFMELATRRETVQGRARHPPRMTPGRRPMAST